MLQNQEKSPDKRLIIPHALQTIGLALNACHNTVTTDIPGVEPDESSWRIDNSDAIKELEWLESILSTSNGICPLCNGRNTGP